MNGKNVFVFSGIIGKNIKIVGPNQNVMKFSVGVGRDQKKGDDGKWTGFTDWVNCVSFVNDPSMDLIRETEYRFSKHTPGSVSRKGSAGSWLWSMALLPGFFR